MKPIDPYLLQQASCRASLLVSTCGFRPDDWEDVRQELILDCLRRSPKFDPSRGEWPGFVRGVVRNHANVLATRRHRTAQREVLASDLSCNEDRGADDPVAVFDGVQRHELEAVLQMRIDVERVLNRLPPQLQRLALLLIELPILEVCAKTGKSRSRIFQMKCQLRAAFVRAGFQPPSTEIGAGRMKQSSIKTVTYCLGEVSRSA